MFKKYIQWTRDVDAAYRTANAPSKVATNRREIARIAKNWATTAYNYQQKYGRQAVAAVNLASDLYNKQYGSAFYTAATFPRTGYSRSYRTKRFRRSYKRFRPSRRYQRQQYYLYRTQKFRNYRPRRRRNRYTRFY